MKDKVSASLQESVNLALEAGDKFSLSKVNLAELERRTGISRAKLRRLKAQDGTIGEFDGSLWGSMVEFVTVGMDKEITVTFRDGTEIQA